MRFINHLYFNFRHFFSSRFPKAYFFCDNSKSVIKFLIAGSFAGAADLIFLFILHGLLKLPIVMSTTMAFVLSFLVSFTLQKFWTFRNHSQERMIRQLIVYILNMAIGLYVNGWLMYQLVDQYNIWYLLAQLMVNLVIGGWNYIAYRFIIFHRH